MTDYILLAIATPFALWAAWSDLKFMLIPNDLSTFAALAFILIMPFFLPLDDFGLRVAIAGWVLIAGFLLNAIGQVGGGDVKFATVMVPYAMPQDYQILLTIYLSALLLCFVLHRVAKLALRNSAIVADWKSFDAGGKFPMGLPMALAILVYLIAKALGVVPVLA